MTAAAAIPVGFIAPLPATKQQVPTPSMMQQLSAKVSALIKTRWVFISLVGLLVTAISAVGFSAFMALTMVESIGAGLIVGGVAALLAGRIAPKDVRALRVFTLNFLGILSDPFEFRGDYGAFINSVKAQVNACLIGKATPKSMRKDKDAIAEDLEYGPKLKNVISDATWAAIVKMIEAKNKESSKPAWNMTNVNAVRAFLDKYGEDKLFYFIRNYPEPFMKWDIEARKADQEKPEGFRAPMVSSPAQIIGDTAQESTLAFAQYLVDRPDTLKCAKGRAREKEKWDNNTFILKGPSKDEKADAKKVLANPKSSENDRAKAQKIVEWKKPDELERANAQKELDKITEDNATALKALTQCHKSKTGETVVGDLDCFKNPEGEAIAVILYQAFNFKLLHQEDKKREAAGQEKLTTLVNRAKTEFCELLGDPYRRAQAFAEKFEQEGADLVFVQECSSMMVKAMAEHGFVSTELERINGIWKVRSKAKSVIFANTRTMDRKFDLLPYDSLDTEQKFPEAVFKRLNTQQSVYAKGIHGSSDNPGEARDAVNKGKAKLTSLNLPKDALCVLAGDTNINNQDEFVEFGVVVDRNDMHATNTGDTSGKEREITPQKKVGLQSRSPKDIIITKKENEIISQSVGFNPYQISPDTWAPCEASIGSDHWATGAEIKG